MILIYITCKDSTQAKAIAKALIHRKLIGCANLHPIESLYTWKGELQEENEVVLIGKTDGRHFDTIKKVVTEMHSYDVPCILRLSAEASGPYKEWLTNQIGP